jgi:hypothetical protein
MVRFCKAEMPSHDVVDSVDAVSRQLFERGSSSSRLYVALARIWSDLAAIVVGMQPVEFWHHPALFEW